MLTGTLPFCAEAAVRSDTAPSCSTVAASGGYYSATFTIPNTKKEVFLTGLTAENIDVIQKKLKANYALGGDFAMESIDFIDAEKVYNNNDSSFCWAATCSDMLKGISKNLE